MGDRCRKKTATISTDGSVSSRKMKKKCFQSPGNEQKITENKMWFRKKNEGNPCNPLKYLMDRQIDDKVDYCKRLVEARLSNSQNLFRKDLYAHYGCVNGIEFSKQGEMLISGGDDKRVLLWNVQKSIEGSGEPIPMKAQHGSNIFCLTYNSSNTKIFSAGNDDQVIVHDLKTTRALDVFHHEKPVYGLSAHPSDDNIFASACDDGRILVYDLRGSETSVESSICVAQHKTPFHSVMFNPVDPVMVATANTKEGIGMWDIRYPLKPVLRYGSEGPTQNCMNVRFNPDGKVLLALRRRLPPVLYNINSPKHICQFDHPGYYNSCTMKSCCFAGNNNEYILSGSDDFNLYMWKIPADDTIDWVDSAHMILRGHRSIVNHVRFNPAGCILASSGVEKIVKIWSPFQLGTSYTGGLRRDDDNGQKQRRVYTHDEYIALVLRSGQLMTHDYSHQSTNEDQRMMAFFDSLVQREIEQWSSEDAPTPQSPSEPENSASDFDLSSDTDDSTMSDRRLMRCFFFCSTLNSRSGSNVPERPLESPNRITRLIANRREKLMRLANLDKTKKLASSTANSTTETEAPVANTSSANLPAANEAENDHATRNKTKIYQVPTRKDVGFKRKNAYNNNRKSRTRRKQTNAKDDSDSDSDSKSSNDDEKKRNFPVNRQQPVEIPPQPSTSSGVVSSGHFTSTSISSSRSRPSLSHSSNDSSDSNYEDNSRRKNYVSSRNAKKRKSEITDSDSSAKETEPQKQKTLRNKSKITSYSRRIKSKRQKINNESINSNNQVKKETSIAYNALINKEVTPSKNSDSGITSGVSTEKHNPSTSEKSNLRSSRGESSDRDRVSKNYEWFKKRVDQARRGYRKRTTLPPPSSSDSSED